MMQIVQSSFSLNLNFDIIFSNSLSQVDVHMAEMYGKNQAVSKCHLIKQTVNTINSNGYTGHLNKLECCGKVHLFQ